MQYKNTMEKKIITGEKEENTSLNKSQHKQYVSALKADIKDLELIVKHRELQVRLHIADSQLKAISESFAQAEAKMPEAVIPEVGNKEPEGKVPKRKLKLKD